MPLVRSTDGSVSFVPDDQIRRALDAGGAIVSAGEAAPTDTAAPDEMTGTTGGLIAGATSLASGATLGLSDVALKGLLSDSDLADVARARNDHSVISTAGNIAGAVLPAVLTGGASAEAEGASSLLAASPASLVGKLGSRIAEEGAGGGLGARVLSTAAAGSAEGALQNAGGYIGDVALGNRKLSADGFVGAMGQGALWGGVAGGALQMSSEGLQSARKLFPSAETTAGAADAARREASGAISDAVDDGAQLAQTAQAKLDDLAAQESIANPGVKQRIDEIRLRAAQDIADAQVARARAQQAAAEVRAKGAQSALDAKSATAAEAAAIKRTKPALDWLDNFAEKGKVGAVANNSTENLLQDTLQDAAADNSGGASAKLTPTADDLLSKLQGTKSTLDSGRSTTDISASKTRDAINEVVAQANPDAAKIVTALGKAKASATELRSWLDKYGPNSAVAYDAASPAARRAKISDWAKGAPAEDVEGEMAQAHFQGDPENTGNRLGNNSFPAEVHVKAREAAADAAHRAYLDTLPEAANVSGSGTELMARSQYAAQRAAAKATDEVYTGVGKAAPTGADIIADQMPVAAKVERAIKGEKGAELADDINETAPMITRHEAAHADLTDALGPAAPASSAARADGFRQAQAAAAKKTAASSAATADAVAKAPGAAKGLLDKATDAATMYQALVQMGVPLPDPHDIPVIGPLLSTYLKAKVIGKAFGRAGAKTAQTSETVIAGKSAAIRQRIYNAADAALDGASKVAGAATQYNAGGAAAILGRKLFDGGKPMDQPYTSAPESGSLGDLYLKRSAEVTASQQPGAIQAAVSKRVHTSDPEVLDEIIATQARVLGYVAKTMPQPAAPPGLLDGRTWLPAKTDLLGWTRVVGATQDPAGVLERASVGAAGSDEVEAVKACYPSLYADAQRHVMEQVADGKGRNLTTPQRANISRVWGLPLDSSSQPGRAVWLQAGHAAAPAATQSLGAPAGQPTISGPVNLGQRTLTRLDQP